MKFIKLCYRVKFCFHSSHSTAVFLSWFQDWLESCTCLTQAGGSDTALTSETLFFKQKVTEWDFACSVRTFQPPVTPAAEISSIPLKSSSRSYFRESNFICCILKCLFYFPKLTHVWIFSTTPFKWITESCVLSCKEPKRIIKGLLLVIDWSV